MEEKKKGGRPTKKVKREKQLSFFASYIENEVINEKVKLSGLLTAQYLRNSALQVEMPAAPTIEELKFYKDLTGVANNLNQLTKKAHEENLFTLVPKLLKTLDSINQTLKTLDNKNKNR